MLEDYDGGVGYLSTSTGNQYQPLALLGWVVQDVADSPILCQRPLLPCP
jgi:hypothetical protein